MLPRADRTRTTGEPFLEDVLGNVMLMTHLRWHAFKEVHCVHLCGNPDDPALRARLAQAEHDLEVVTAAMRSL
jgi:hypothetical protein